MNETRGSFEIQMGPDGDELEGRVNRMAFEKQWDGGLVGDSAGVFLACGDPRNGQAGYVVAEYFNGELEGLVGGFTFLQLGIMSDGEQQLTYVIAPGSGAGQLEGITGTLSLGEGDGHDFLLVWDLPGSSGAQSA